MIKTSTSKEAKSRHLLKEIYFPSYGISKDNLSYMLKTACLWGGSILHLRLLSYIWLLSLCLQNIFQVLY